MKYPEVPELFNLIRNWKYEDACYITKCNECKFQKDKKDCRDLAYEFLYKNKKTN